MTARRTPGCVSIGTVRSSFRITKALLCPIKGN
jgi:hypothetical protein